MRKLFIILFTSAFFNLSAQTDAGLQINAISKPLSWDVKPLEYKTTANSITIKAGKETDLYSFVDASYYVNNAPKMLFTPDSGFVFSAKIKPAFKSLYDGGAILVYSDEGNWAKALFEQHNDGSFGLGVSLVEEKRGDDSYHAVKLEANEVSVKVARSGNVFCFYYATDGKTWKLLRTFPYRKFENMRIGFYAQSPKGENCTVEFLDIRYKGQKFTDFVTGE
jgi:regulation of enolase protein 1 (concanavalin A-like superfamily)